MKYFISLAIVAFLVGCGGSGSSEKTPSSPKTKDMSKQPPSLPNIY
jgi:hypothetical protein